MKKSLILLLFCLHANLGFSQLAEKGTGTIQLGYGFPSVMSSIAQVMNFSVSMADDTNSRASFSYKPIGPVHFRFDYMVGGRVGLGLSSNFAAGRFTLTEQHTNSQSKIETNKYYFDYSSVNIMARTTIHFLKRNPRLDIYYAHSVGVHFSKVKLDVDFMNDNFDPDQQFFIDEFNSYMNSLFKFLPVAMEGQFGIKWALTPYAGMYFEAGYSKAYCQLGLFAKIGRSPSYYRSDWKYYR
ncbi:MAG: hypothetical protein JNM95_12035 [Chitinophagaceae bacterium]|nr:hypothetical protein [Chitinophagaceae bacterium]